MSYSVSVTARFDREAKRIKKKYPSLKKELDELVTLLEREPEQAHRSASDASKCAWRCVRKAKASRVARA